MISLKQSWNFVTVHKKLFMILGLFALIFIVVPEIANAQTGSIKISSLSDVEAKAEEGSNTILNIAKYVLGAVLGVALIFVIYALATNQPHAKEYLLGWIIAVAVIMVAFLII
ncbi:hypothetical protein NXX03_28240 (plasmid) [Bacteroides thetaiotaomicron]|nr:hypothetical protein [Bacteroides thetaiotaomicron]MCS3371786.1 hypothetical protein [Bacteroides thetaiotaomicron]